MTRTARPDARAALLDAAREEFARHGLERARVEDIARRAGISKGAFYLHFATKEDAFREIVARFLGALEERARHRDEVEERSHQAGASLREVTDAARAADADLLDLLWRNRRILAAVDGAPDKLRRDVDDFLRKVRALVARRMADGTSARVGVRGDVPPDLLADIIVGTYRGFARRMLERRERRDLEAWARALRAVLYEGILERPGARTRGLPYTLATGAVREMRELAAKGWGAKRIARELGLARSMVRRYLRGGPGAEVQGRPTARCLDEAARAEALALFDGAADRNAVVVADILAQRGSGCCRSVDD